MIARPHPKALPKRPVGQPTRGKTARNRLRRVDTFLSLYCPSLISRKDGDFGRALFVDLGYGATPNTTLESAARLRRLNPELGVLGVEIAPERVESAQAFADDRTHFRLGGFNLPLRERETVRVIRAFNLLRQYDETEVAEAHALLGRQLLPGGLLIEGTSDPFGRTWVANLLRRTEDAGAGLKSEGLVFSMSLRIEFDPAMFQPVLPKNYIHHMTPGEPIHAFFETWKQAARETIAMKTWGPRSWFVAAAQRVAEFGWTVCLRRNLLTRGFLVVKVQ